MIFKYLTQLILIAPLMSLGFVIFSRLINHGTKELVIKKSVGISQSISLFSSLVCLCHFLFISNEPVKIIDFNILHIGKHHQNFELVIDQLSIVFVVVTCILGGVVGLFASRYLHKDPGYFRFFVLYHLFILGMHTIVQAAGLPTLFIGWEVVGLTSALLISFFGFRKQTVVNSLRAFWAYRVTDSGLLVATLIAIHFGVENFTSNNPVDPQVIFIIGACCLLSAMGKSAQFPFSHWLPRAMEGPTPSSAIFYGGLSVHAGLYLILRISTVYNLPASLSIAMVVIGLISAIYGALLGKIQSDAKSSLAYGAMTQVGIMFIEVGFHFHSLAVLHFVGHSMLRTYQLLNAASLLHDRQALNHVLGSTIPVNKHHAAKNKFLYSYAFWESTGGMFTRFSLLDSLEKVANKLRSIDNLFLKFQIILSKQLLWFAYKIIKIFLKIRRNVKNTYVRDNEL